MNTGSEKNSVRISAVICTYRRLDTLPTAIESLLAQTLAKEQYEIIVVDNNSGDETAHVVKSYRESAKAQLRYILEPKQGLSCARNTGIQESCGNIIAFLDDDAEAAPEWLAALLKGYENNPDAWAIGGKVLPIWDSERPQWLPDGLLPHLSLLDWGNSIKRLEKNQHVAGVNCSFRQEVFATVGYFPTDIGRIGDSLLAGEEAELIRRIHLQRKAVYYLPEAVVYHHISQERLTKKYFRKRLYLSGWSKAIFENRTYGIKCVSKNILHAVLILPIKLVWTQRFLCQECYRAKMFQYEVQLRSMLGYVIGFLYALYRSKS